MKKKQPPKKRSRYAYEVRVDPKYRPRIVPNPNKVYNRKKKHKNKVDITE